MWLTCGLTGDHATKLAPAMATVSRNCPSSHDYIKAAFVNALASKGEDELKAFPASSNGFPAFPTLRGVLYEGYALNKLMRGGQFTIRELEDDGRGAEKTVRVPHATERLFRRLKEVAEVATICTTARRLARWRPWTCSFRASGSSRSRRPRLTTSR